MKKEQCGFTLIELLLGLSIFAIISLSLYTTFASGIKISKKSEKTHKVLREIRWAIDQMALDIENMAAYDFSNFRLKHGSIQKTKIGETYSKNVSITTNTNDPSLQTSEILGFSGEADRMSLLLPTNAGLKVINYVFRSPDYGTVHETDVKEATEKNTEIVISKSEEPQSDNLVREEKSFVDHLRMDEENISDSEILCTHIKKGGGRFQYAYVDPKSEIKQISWRDSWTEKFLPFGVRVEVKFIHPDAKDKDIAVKRDILIPIGFWGNPESN